MKDNFYEVSTCNFSSFEYCLRSFNLLEATVSLYSVDLRTLTSCLPFLATVAAEPLESFKDLSVYSCALLPDVLKEEL